MDGDGEREEGHGERPGDFGEVLVRAAGGDHGTWQMQGVLPTGQRPLVEACIMGGGGKAQRPGCARRGGGEHGLERQACPSHGHRGVGKGWHRQNAMQIEMDAIVPASRHAVERGWGWKA